MEFYRVFWLFFMWISVLWNSAISADVSQVPTVSNTANGIWALSSRSVGIFLASFDGSEITSQTWRASFPYRSDVAFDPERKSLLYCEPVGNVSPRDCALHLTSLDQCYDEVVATIEMEHESTGLELDSESRLAYLSIFELPGIMEVNIKTGQQRMIFDTENVLYVRISPDKRKLYFTCLSTNENHIRRGNIDGTGALETLLTRTQQIIGFGIDFPASKMYYTQGSTILSTDLNGNNEQELITDTGTVYEMSVIANYLYWGNNDAFKRLSLTGNPSANMIETLISTTGGNFYINHLFITPSQIEMSKSILSLSSSNYVANESIQSLTIKVIRTGNLFRCSCADLVIRTGTRRFTRQAIENTLNFASGETTQSLTLTWENNNEPDGPDEVMVELLSNAGAKVGVLGTAMIRIRDDDCSYSFDTTGVTVDEDVGYVDVTVKRICSGTSPPVAATIRVQPEESDGGAQEGLDFVSGATNIQFSSGEDTAVARIYINNDVQPEDLEKFVLRILLPDNGILSEPNTVTISVTDHDTLYIINQDQTELLESQETINIVVHRLGNTSMPGSVRLAALGQDAELQTDFRIDPNSDIIQFASGTSEVMVPIAIINDNLLENNETFEVFLHSPMNGYLDARKTTVVTVIDDEVEITLSASRLSCLESRECSVTVNRKGYLEQTTTARIQTEDLSAFAGSDFIDVDTMVTFNPWVISQEIRITLIDDNTRNPQTSFFIVITDVIGGRAGEPSRANVALWDDDDELPVLVYSLEQSSYTLLESDGTLEIVILRGGSYLGQNGSVRVETSPTTMNNGDYEDLNMVVNFEEFQSRQTIIITVNNDEIIEETDTFIVQLSDAKNGVLGEQMRATVSIVDDDVSYSLERSTYPVHENERERVVTVQRDGYLQQTGYVTLQVRGGTATFEDDYLFSPIGQNLKFEPGQTKRATIITIIDDEIEENTETIEIVLSKPQNGTLGEPSSGAVVIEDNDMTLESATLVAPSQTQQQIGTVAIVVIALAAIVLSILTIILCALGAFVCSRRQPRLYPSQRYVGPQRNFPPEYKIPPQSPNTDYYRSLYGREKVNVSALYGARNPILYSQDYYRSTFNGPKVNRQLALPSTDSYTNP